MGASTAQDDGTYTHVVDAHVMSEWDPAVMYTRENIGMANVYETLTYYNGETEEVEPRLATEWDASEDGLTWSFSLREDVTFHSGEPLTAEAVQAALERTIDLELGASYLWAAVSEITVPDEHTVEFELDYPAALDQIAAAAFGSFIYEVPDEGEPDDYAGADEDSPFYGAGLGTGPYTVEDYDSGQEYELTLNRYEDYWGGWEDDQVERVEYRVVEEPATAAQLLQQGEAHSVQALPTELLDDLRNDDRVEILEQASFQNLLLFLNTEVAPLDDPLMRQAVAHAVDYDAITDVTGGGLTKPQGMMPLGLFGAETGNQMPVTDPDTVEDLLAEAGWDLDTDEAELELTVNAGEPDQQQFAELLQSQLAEINMLVTIEELPYEQQIDRARNPEPDQRQHLLTGRWWPDAPVVDGWYASLFRTEEEPFFNLSGYSDPALDELIDEVPEVTAVDPERAEQMYAEMEQTVIDDMPVIVLGDAVYRRAVAAEVSGWVDNPLYANVVWAYELTL